MIAATFGPGDAGIAVAVVVLIALSALLALTETSLVRTSRARARALAEAGHRSARTLERLVEDPEAFLAPVLLLVLVCQLVAATLVGVLAGHLFGALGIVVATVFEVVVIFVVAEAVPKHWAVRHPDRAALLAAPLVAAVVSFPPVRFVASALIGLSHLVTRGDDEDQSDPEVTESELLAFADVAVEAEAIESDERALLSSIIAFGDTVVREVMVPRPDIVAVDGSTPVGAVLELSIARGLSRIPVFRESVDDVSGIAFTRDLIRAARGGDQRPVREFAREATYVPETKRVAPLLREMQREQFHLAVVVDEYGVTAGIVTLEDLIEELVGEIADEFDVEEPQVEAISESELLVPGQMPVDEVNELLGAELPVGDWDTIAGLAFHLLGSAPREGERIAVAGFDIVIERVQGRRIRRVRLVRREPRSEPAEERVS